MNEKHVIQRFVKAKKLFGKYALLFMLCSFSLVSAQNSDVKITGTVLEDSNGQPLFGVSIYLKGTKTGVATDVDGSFSIKAKIGETLVASYLGYVSAEVKVTDNQLKIRLKEDRKVLDDVVVIGYGKAKRKDLTGSISSISGEELLKTRPVTFDQALQGKVAGVVVQQTSGQPGGGVNIQIRGLSSFGGSSPLYVIDGVIIGQSYGTGNGTNPLAAISPSDIQSIDVLKDASATAIYGSQATNGVIVITTKRGREGAPKITYEFTTGYQELIKKYPTMDLREYGKFINDRATVWGFDTRPEFANPQYLGKGTNWQDELFRKAPVKSHTLTLSGGNDKTQYLLSGSYFNQEGIAIGSEFTRTSLRLNLDNKTTDWLKVGTSLQLTHIDENVNSTGSNVIAEALGQTPDIPVRNPDGSFAGEESSEGWIAKRVNPYALALINKNNPKRNQFFGNLYTEIAFTKALSFRNEVSGNFSFSTEDRYSPTYKFGLAERVVNDAFYSYSQDYFTTFRSFLTYAKVFKNKYNVNAVAGHEAQLSQYEDVSAARRNFISDAITNIGSGDALTATNGGTKRESAQESYFGRVNFIYNDKYLFTVNARADGTSKFAAENRWVTTYSGAFAWKLNNEKFLKGSKIVNELKLRVGYGLTNNQNAGNNANLTLLTSTQNGLSGNAQVTSNLGNPELEWEKTEYSNAGIDAALFGWKLNFSVDVYNRLTDGLLLQVPLPAYSGTTAGYSPGAIAAPYINAGTVRNRGVDFHLNSRNITGSGDDFNWSTDFTLSHNKNKVMKLNTDGASLPGYLGGEVVAQTKVGGSIGDFYGYKVDGIFATASDFETHALPTDTDGNVLPVRPTSGGVWYGDLKFKDLNGDGVITEKDRTYLGSPIPDFQLGLGNNFSYKGFDLNIFFSANIGNEVVNGMRINGENPLTNYGYLKSLNNYAQLALIDPNGSASDVNNVYVTNPNTTIIGLRNGDSNRNNRFSDKYVENGSFIRCKNMTLGYTMPNEWMQKMHINSLRMYVSVTNPFLITKYKGMDPEVGSWNPLQAGIDYGFYPQARTFTLGINVGLTK
ncbi:SusC/RagA family TonB-linked outer membrane protein [Flavobacterium sp. CF136]|uniref:SusC/RagA family TonB-linked outer membrane protein n=1 Tax=Flavobacterium sp. (strain CF136) TaxID=1144313 RepID=UPI0002719605|nr:TonB-dependent receptor [Flavobacterium sp. CF136]EJL67200.1 TonB-linked outer membrane protein, SusC/RagA family [Flavobacterium sp. CF136]